MFNVKKVLLSSAHAEFDNEADFINEVQEILASVNTNTPEGQFLLIGLLDLALNKFKRKQLWHIADPNGEDHPPRRAVKAYRERYLFAEKAKQMNPDEVDNKIAELQKIRDAMKTSDTEAKTGEKRGLKMSTKISNLISEEDLISGSTEKSVVPPPRQYRKRK